jgi:dienelactone hydrolase
MIHTTASRDRRHPRAWTAGLRRIAALAVAGLVMVPLHAAPLPVGASETALDVEGTRIPAYAYKPPSYHGGPLLLVLHGLGRNAAGYRDYARPLADRYGLLVVAPLFERRHFPTWRYQWGGVATLSADGEVRRTPEHEGLVQALDGIVRAVRGMENAPHLPYAFIGHSAGGQALSRYAAYGAHGASRIVVANPSTYLWPTAEIGFPYGLAGLPPELADEPMVRRYLAQPLIVLLGTADVKHDRDLNVSAGAMSQGPNRYERGREFFRAGKRLAEERGWPFGWRLIEVPGVGHSARRMFAADEAAAALADFASQ